MSLESPSESRAVGLLPAAPAGRDAPRKKLEPHDQLDLLNGAAPVPMVAYPVYRGGRQKRTDKPVKSKDGPPILRALRKETGLGSKELARAERLHKGDPYRQIEEFFNNFIIPAATGRKRTVGLLTEKIYIDQMNVMVTSNSIS
jgi:hypothetical protein